MGLAPNRAHVASPLGHNSGWQSVASYVRCQLTAQNFVKADSPNARKRQRLFMRAKSCTMAAARKVGWVLAGPAWLVLGWRCSTEPSLGLPTGDRQAVPRRRRQSAMGRYRLLLTLGGALAIGRHARRPATAGRLIFTIGVVWFAAASLLCELAPNAVTLIAARTLQGIGGALVTPGSLAILQSVFVKNDRARAIRSVVGSSGAAARRRSIARWLSRSAPFLGDWCSSSHPGCLRHHRHRAAHSGIA